MDTVLYKHGVKPPAAVADGQPVTVFQGRRVKLVSAPLSQKGAYARAQRFHELLHANYDVPLLGARRTKASHYAVQAIADVIVHYVHWPENVSESLLRDTVCAAAHDIRTIEQRFRTGELGIPDIWNINLVAAARAIAILLASRHAIGISKLADKLTQSLSYPVAKSLESIVVGVRDACRGARRKIGPKLQLLEAEFDTLLLRPESESKSDSGKNPGGATSEGPKMDIIKLPLNELASPRLKRSQWNWGQGRLSIPRVVSALGKGPVEPLWRRTIRHKGGTLLIDASGSMSLSQSEIETFLLASPLAQVAYYSGAIGYGELVICAADGYRATAIREPLGGNTVDLPAVQWLLRQPKPRILVTDLAFCGAPQRDLIFARSLVLQAISANELKLADQLKAAIKLQEGN